MSQIDMQVETENSSGEFDLLNRIESFELDSPKSKLTFSARLSRENGWKHDYAKRVIREYKRFAYLAMIAGHPVTPSDAVDQAWHLHMIYTESYWRDFCGNVLGKPLHHGPTKGGPTEGAKHLDWYTRTLESYRRIFREEPPIAIWPSPEERFSDAAHYKRVNTRHTWIIPKPKFWQSFESAWSDRKWRTLRPLALRSAWAICLTLAFVGCVESINVFNYSGPRFLEFYVFLAAISITLAAGWSYFQRLPARSAQEEDLPTDPYEMACLTGGNQRVVETAFAELLRLGAVEVETDGKVRSSLTSKPNRELHPIEARLHANLGKTTGERFLSLQQRLTRLAAPLIDELSSRGLMLNDRDANKLRRQTLLIAGIAPAIGILKIMVGISRDKPVGFLVVLTIITTLITLALFGRRPLRTRLGDSALSLLKVKYSELRVEDALSRRMSHGSAAEVPIAIAVGLFGFEMLANTAMAEEYRRVLFTYNSTSDSGGSGCGSSDGGGGCGGGCGGCGGGGD